MPPSRIFFLAPALRQGIRRRPAGRVAGPRPRGPGVPPPTGEPSIETTGSDLADRRREERLVRGEQPLEREDALLDVVAGLRREPPDGGARHAREERQLERRREQASALAEPDVRGRRLEHRAVGRDEQGVVGAAARRVVLRRHVLGVARRLRAGERAGRPATTASRSPRARSSSRPSGSSRRARARRRAAALARPPSRAGAATRRARRRRAIASNAALLERVARRRRPAAAAGRGGEPVEMRVEHERHAAVDAQRLEHGAAAQHALVVGVQHRRVGRNDAATRAARARRASSTPAPAAARRSRRGAAAP